MEKMQIPRRTYWHRTRYKKAKRSISWHLQHSKIHQRQKKKSAKHCDYKSQIIHWKYLPIQLKAMSTHKGLRENHWLISKKTPEESSSCEMDKNNIKHRSVWAATDSTLEQNHQQTQTGMVLATPKTIKWNSSKEMSTNISKTCKKPLWKPKTTWLSTVLRDLENYSDTTSYN